jgi:hypothetical protein
MAVEIAIVGYTNSPPLQAFYMLLGAVITGLGLGWRMSDNLTYVAYIITEAVAQKVYGSAGPTASRFPVVGQFPEMRSESESTRSTCWRGFSEFVGFDLDRPTDWANECRIHHKPGDCLLENLLALRALNRDFHVAI